MISAVISRDGTDLTIGDSPSGSMWIPEDGLARPARGWRKKYADESAFYHGSLLTAAVLEQTSLPLAVYCKAASTAALEALQDELEDAVSQFAYTTTVTIDGVAKAWACDPADLSWGDVDSGEVRAFIVRASLVIPVYPIAGV